MTICTMQFFSLFFLVYEWIRLKVDKMQIAPNAHNHTQHLIRKAETRLTKGCTKQSKI